MKLYIPIILSLFFIFRELSIQKYFYELFCYDWRTIIYHKKAFFNVFENFQKKNSWWEYKLLERKQEIITKVFNQKTLGHLNSDWYDFHGYKSLVKTYEIFI